MEHYFKKINTPAGQLTLVADTESLLAILWENDSPKRVPVQQGTEKKDHPILLETEKQLHEYFTGQRKEFSIPLKFTGTNFQKQVWQALLTIPYGETRSYGQLARQLNNPGSVRAVGAANGKNPISIIWPCHRVVGAGGSLTGFAGGLDNKLLLLKLENSRANFTINQNMQLDIFKE